MTTVKTILNAVCITALVGMVTVLPHTVQAASKKSNNASSGNESNVASSSGIRIFCELEDAIAYVDGAMKGSCNPKLNVLVTPGEHIVVVSTQPDSDGLYKEFVKTIVVGEGAAPKVDANTFKSVGSEEYWWKKCESGDPNELNNYVKNYPSGKYVKQAKKLLEDKQWAELEKEGKNGLYKYLKSYPTGHFVSEDVYLKISELLNPEGNKLNISEKSPYFLNEYVNRYPNGKFIAEAKIALARSREKLILFFSKYSKDANLFRNKLTSDEAQIAINKLNNTKFEGYTNWHIPNTKNLLGLSDSDLFEPQMFDYLQDQGVFKETGVINIQTEPYWFEANDAGGKEYFPISFAHNPSGLGFFTYKHDSNKRFYVWPVHD